MENIKSPSDARLRDYFAVTADISTLCDANGTGLAQSAAEHIMGRAGPLWSSSPEEALQYWLEATAKARYLMADAMMKARA